MFCIDGKNARVQGEVIVRSSKIHSIPTLTRIPELESYEIFSGVLRANSLHEVINWHFIIKGRILFDLKWIKKVPLWPVWRSWGLRIKWIKSSSKDRLIHMHREIFSWGIWFIFLHRIGQTSKDMKLTKNKNFWWSKSSNLKRFLPIKWCRLCWHKHQNFQFELWKKRKDSE